MSKAFRLKELCTHTEPAAHRRLNQSTPDRRTPPASPASHTHRPHPTATPTSHPYQPPPPGTPTAPPSTACLAMQAAFAPLAPLPCRRRPVFTRRSAPVASAGRPDGGANRLPLWAVAVTKFLRPAALSPTPAPIAPATHADRLRDLADGVAAETAALRAALHAAEARAAAAENAADAAWDALDHARIGREADVAHAIGAAHEANRRMLGAMLSAQARAARAEREAGGMVGTVVGAEKREVTAKNNAVQISALASLVVTAVITFFLHAATKGDVAERVLHRFL